MKTRNILSAAKTMAMIAAAAMLAVLTVPAAAQKGAEPVNPKLAKFTKDADLGKITLDLLEVRQDARARGVAAKDAPKASSFAKTKKGVVVEAYCTRLNDQVLQKFARPGIEVVQSFPKYGVVYLAVEDLEDLDAVAKISEVGMIKPQYKPVTMYSGSVDSRADRALSAKGVVQGGVTGAGQKIGVLSDSFALTEGVRDGDTNPPAKFPGVLTGSKPQDTGDLPQSVTILRDDMGGDLTSTPSDEGAAMAELIHDVAPGAEIAFHTAAGGTHMFADGINRLRNEAKSTIIVDDIMYLASEPCFQDGPISQAAASAVSAGVPYFTAAGNMGSLGIASAYVDVNPAVDDTAAVPTGNDLHDWGNGMGGFLPIQVPHGAKIILQWNQPWYSLNGNGRPANMRAGSSIDLDMYVTSAATPGALATPVAVSKNLQGMPRQPMGDAVEFIDLTGGTGADSANKRLGEDTLFLAIEHFQGSETNIPQNRREPLRFRVIIFAPEGKIQGYGIGGSAAGGPTIYGHALAAGVVAVGAVPWWEAPTFNPTFPPTAVIDPEPFTSRGGALTVMFDSKGRFMKRPRTVRVPQMCGVDGCNTTFFGEPDTALTSEVLAINYDGEPDGFPNFFGTSAAAPNVAAVAALVKSVNTGMTPTQLTDRLSQTAVDVTGHRCAVGWDDVSGQGLVNAQRAIDPDSPEPRPNLAFVLPDGWSVNPAGAPPLVINQDLNSRTDATTFTIGDDIYVHFAITNNGERYIAAPFNVTLSVVGDDLTSPIVVRTYTVPSLGVGVVNTFTETLVGLPGGIYTFTVRLDPPRLEAPNGDVEETNETDNVIERGINTESDGPNLTFGIPTGGTSNLVINQSETSTEDTSSFNADLDVYVHFRVVNNGSRLALPTTAMIYVNGVMHGESVPVPELPAVVGFYDYVRNIGRPTGAAQTIRVECDVPLDSQGVLSETNESDNYVEKVINSQDLPNLTFTRPAGWTTDLIVNQTLGSTQDAVRIDNTRPVYISYIVINNGSQPVASSFSTIVEIDGAPVQTFTTVAPFAVGQTETRVDINLGALPAGAHTIRVFTDSGLAVQESSESDNERIRLIEVGQAPSNDNFVNAVDLGSCPTQTVANNYFATTEAGEPFHAGNRGGSSIWYRLTTPPSDPDRPIRLTIDTIGSNFNTLLAVYQGASVNALSFVAANDDIIPGSIVQSRVTFEAAGSQVFYIAVDGYNGEQGDIVLNISLGINNDDFENASLLTGRSGTTETLNFCATKQVNEPNHAGNAGGHSLWYTWVATQNGMGMFTTSGSRIDTLLAVYTGTALDALTLVAQNDDLAATPPPDVDSYVTFPITEGVRYYIAVDGKNGVAGNITLSWSAGPSNDFFGSPTVLPSTLSGLCGTSSSNVGAGHEPGEPLTLGNAGGASVWFKWTAPEKTSGSVVLDYYPVTFDTIGSSFNTILGIFQGNSIATISMVGYNDDVNLALNSRMQTSRVSFTAFTGQTYYILVDGFNGATGNILLNWDDSFAPQNDFVKQTFFFPVLETSSTCASIVGFGEEFPELGTTEPVIRSTKAASVEPGTTGPEPPHANEQGKRSVWYTLTIPSQPECANYEVRLITMYVTSVTPGFDPLLGVYVTAKRDTTDDVSKLSSYAYNDDIVPGTNVNCMLSFIAVPGTYYYVIDGKNCTSGNFSLSIKNEPAPEGTPVPPELLD